MIELRKTLGVLAACALLGTSTARAEGFKPGSGCNASGFTTCNAVHLSVLRDGLSIGQQNNSFRNWESDGRNRTFKFVPDGDGVAPGKGGFDVITPGSCPVPSGNPHDCPPVTVTPEPVTMTLLATGLLSMSGMGLVSRKRKHLVE
jgi:hypothetical protein